MIFGPDTARRALPLAPPQTPLPSIPLSSPCLSSDREAAAPQPKVSDPFRPSPLVGRVHALLIGASVFARRAVPSFSRIRRTRLISVS
jgi:hypothetical protein